MITYKMNDNISLEKLTNLYKNVGWTGYTNHPEIMAKLLSGAFLYISAWDGNELVGLIRAIGDGCYILYIQDLLVHPDYQRKGIGLTLMNRMLEIAKEMRQIILSTDNTEQTIQFYRSMGFVAMEETGSVTFTYRGDIK